MKKLLLVMLLIAALLLTGCAGKEQSAATQAPAQATEQPTVTEAPVTTEAAARIPDCEALGQAILSSQAFVEDMEELAQKKALTKLDLAADDCAQLWMAMDFSMTTPEAVIVITAKDEATARDVISPKLEAYRLETLRDYQDYRPEEAPKLNTGVMRNSTQCVLVIGGDHAKAAEAVAAMWK